MRSPLLARIFFLSIAVIVLTVPSTAQVATGRSQFGSYGGGPFDVVNLGNLNANFTIPVIHKQGRGLAFNYDLIYNSSVWYPATSGSTTSWTPVTNWGWTSNWGGVSGYLTYSGPITYCYDGMGHPNGETSYWQNWVYHDPWSGKTHAFPGQMVIYSGGCTGTSIYSFTSAAPDNSGLTLSVNTGAGTITDSKGASVAAPNGAPTGPISAPKTDANGNQITSATSGVFTDTLGTTALTISGVNPVNFTYTAPSGGSASYALNYGSYNVRTNFGCSTVSEYTANGVNLVSGITLPDGTTYAFTYEATPGFSGYTTGRLQKVTIPSGGSITYTYTGSNNGIICTDGSTAGLNRAVSPGGTWTYARSGSGNAWTTTVTDPSPTANYTVISFSKDSATINPSLDFYETQRQVYQGSISTSNLLETTTRCYNTNYSACPTATISSPITQTDVYSQLPNGRSRLSEIVYSGSLISDDKEYDYGAITGSAPGNTKLVRETAISYASLGNGIVDKPASVTVSDWSGGTQTTLSYSTYSYDQTTPTATSGTPQLISVSGSRGNLTTATTLTSASSSLTRSYSYYDTGNPYVATDVNGTNTTYAYGSASCGNSFPTSVTYVSSFSDSLTWNCTGGVVTVATDQNGNNVTTTYNDTAFWRPAAIYDPQNNETTIGYAGQTQTQSVLSFNGGNSQAVLRTTLDGLGRLNYSQRWQGPGSSGNYDTTEFDYNNVGQMNRTTMLYSAAASPSSSNTTAPGVTTTYDALGRVLTQTDALGGTVSYTYTNNYVLQKITGTQAFQKQLEYDGLGRLASVCEVSSTLPNVGPCGQSPSAGLWTTYTYDALGRLLTVTQNAQATSGMQTRSFTYDRMGRMTSEANPESGTKNYYYDSDTTMCGNGPSTSNGDLVKTTDAAGNCVMYYSDALHRISDVGNNNQALNHCRRFRYDNSAGYTGSTKPTGLVNTLGRLIEATTDFCSGTNDTILTDEWFSYSARGELTDVYQSTPHSGGYYHTTAAYWPTGALETLSGIPGVPTINYGAAGAGLDGEGRYTKVTASSGTNPVTAVTYETNSAANPLGSLLKVTFGSADFDSFTYNPKTGRMATYTFSVNSVTDKGTLTWNTNGTLKTLAIVDGISGTSDTQTCNYLYDDAQRVSSANCGTPWSQTFTYDSFGNISKSGSATFLPIYASSTNQFTSIPGVNVRYDANGELLTDNLNTYTWNVYSNPITVNSTSLIYDAFGQMVEQQNGSAYTEILYSPVGKTALMTGQTLSKAFVNLPGGATAIYNSSGTLAYYRHSDWLGSSRLSSTQARGSYSSTAYAPFGEKYATSGTADASFTGKNQDTASTLYDFPARLQSPSQGRWISPDPAGLAAVNAMLPQTWNAYTYVENNPLIYIDPDGTSDCNGDVCVWGGDFPGVELINVTASNVTPDTIPYYEPSAANNGPSKTGCFVKGVVAGAVTAVVVGTVAVVAAPVVGATAVTVGLGALAVAGTASLGWTASKDIRNHNWAGVAYDAGSVVGGLATGIAGGPRIATAIDPNATPGWSPQSWSAQAYDSSKGSFGDWMGTGPTHASGGVSTGAGGWLSTLFGAGCH